VVELQCTIEAVLTNVTTNSQQRRNEHFHDAFFFLLTFQGELTMRSTRAIGGLLASVMLVPAFAQSNPPARNERPAASTTTNEATQVRGDVWRASKLKGLNVYNEQNEKLGDINELLVDKSGKIEGVVIGVGGFLGMGEHDIKVDMSKLKFVDEPVRTSSTTTTTTNTTTGAANRPANTTTTTDRTNDHRWYPDHAILNGASKEQLKALPQFKF
jgi:sporulation protein YlmC with PRC-barrel domain